MFGHYKPLLDKMCERIRAGQRAATGLRVGILGGPGHGDHARALAFADGVAEEHPGSHVTFLGRFTGSMVEHDMLGHAKDIGVVDEYVLSGARVVDGEGGLRAVDAPLPRAAVVSAVRGCFDVVYDCVPYAVKAYWHTSITCTEEQTLADTNLAPFRLLYDGHPHLDWMLRDCDLSIWDIMSASSGIAVSPHGLAAATPCECAALPSADDLGLITDETGQPNPARALALIEANADTDNWERVRLEGVGDYVVLHNGVGARGQSKAAPTEVWNAVASFLESEGIRSVQVGNDACEKIKGAIDRRGARLPWTCSLIRDALCVVTTESLVAYMAAGLDISSVVLFGSTPRGVFTMGDMNIDVARTLERDGEQRMACPLGCCFRMDGYGRVACLLPKSLNDTGHCLNVALPADAARAAVGLAKASRDRRAGVFTVSVEGTA